MTGWPRPWLRDPLVDLGECVWFFTQQAPDCCLPSCVGTQRWCLRPAGLGGRRLLAVTPAQAQGFPLLTGVAHLQICGVSLVAVGVPALEGAQLGGDGPSVNSMCPLPVPPAPSWTCGTTPQLRSAGPLPSSFFRWDPVHRALWLGLPTSRPHSHGPVTCNPALSESHSRGEALSLART